MHSLVSPWLGLYDGSAGPARAPVQGAKPWHEAKPPAEEQLLLNAPPPDRDELLRELKKTLIVAKKSRPQAEERLPLILAAAGNARVTSPAQLAYVLATAEHESGMGSNMDEDYNGRDRDKYFESKYGPGSNPAKNLGNTQKGDGAKYFGRGFVQLTGRRNYTSWTKRLKAEGYKLDGKDVDLVAHPELAMRPELAAKIMAEGMRDGSFTGKRLDKYVNNEKTDFHNARRVINGTDRADKIGGRAQKFLAVLKRHPKALEQLGRAGAVKPAKAGGTRPWVESSGSLQVPARRRGQAHHSIRKPSVAGRQLIGAGMQACRHLQQGTRAGLTRIGGEAWMLLPAVAKKRVRAVGRAAAGSLAHARAAVSSAAHTLQRWFTPTTEASIHRGAPTNGDLTKLLAGDRLTPEQISEARELIERQPTELQGELYQQLQAKVPYHNQRNNKSAVGGTRIGDKMCNLTALAMALEALGIHNPELDQYPQFEDYLEALRVRKKLPARTDRGGWGGVAKAMGADLQILSEAGAHKQEWWEKQVRPKLRAGYSVMLSITGHIVRLQEVAANGLVVDDPYGSAKLKKGTARGWKATNKKTGPGESETAGAHGENAVWPWAEVEPHSMLWIAALKRA